MSSLESKLDTVADECIAVRARLISRGVTAIYDAALRAHKLKVSQMNLLVATSRHGVAEPAVICRTLHMSASTLSRNVDRMCKQGWLERVATEDARAGHFRVTAAGRRLLARAWPAWQKAQVRAAALLGERGVRDLQRIADRLWRAAE